jgi:hypothetical protein
MLKHRFICIIFSVVSAVSHSCDLNDTTAVAATLPSLLDDGPPRKISLSNNVQLDIPDAEGVLRMHSADSLVLLDQLTNWPTETGQISSIKAQPVVLDQNYDGIADAVYTIDSSGRLWFIPLTRSGFAEPELVADFSDIAAEFRQPLQLLQTLAPVGVGLLQRQTMLLIIASMAAGGDTLLVVKHLSPQRVVIQLSDLTDRTYLSDAEAVSGIAEQLWQQVQLGAGWYVSMDKRITAVPQVYAGVVYLSSAEVAAVQSDCSLAENTELEIHALHLHHAGAVYARRHWQIAALERGKLVLQKNPQGELELSLHNEQQQQSVQTDLLAITPDCANCVVALTADQFPRISRLATFQAEQDGH